MRRAASRCHRAFRTARNAWCGSSMTSARAAPRGDSPTKYSPGLDGCDRPRAAPYAAEPKFSFGGGERFEATSFQPQDPSGNVGQRVSPRTASASASARLTAPLQHTSDTPGPVYAVPSSLGARGATITREARCGPSVEDMCVTAARASHGRWGTRTLAHLRTPRGARARKGVPGPGSYALTTEDRRGALLRLSLSLSLSLGVYGPASLTRLPCRCTQGSSHPGSPTRTLCSRL